MDDVFIVGTNKEAHSERLTADLQRLEAAGVMLNLAQCEFGRSRVKFVGHIINANGIQVDPNMTSAICKLGPPSNVPNADSSWGW